MNLFPGGPMPSNTPSHCQLPWLRNFLTIWSGQTISMLSSAVTRFALVWWLARETDSAQVLATATIFALAPDIVILPLVGTLVDRWDRRTIMLAADGFMALLTLVLATLLATDTITLPCIYLYLLATSAGQVFHRTAMVTATQQLVPLSFLPRVQGFNTSLWGLSSLLTPPLAALLLTILDLQAILLIDAATAACSMAPLLFLRLPCLKADNQSATAATDKEGFWRHLTGGMTYLSAHRELLALLVCVALGGLLLMPAFTYLPLLVKNHFRGGAQELAWLEAAWGGGILCGGVLFSLRKSGDRQVRIMLTAMIGVGLGYGCLTALPATMFFWTLPLMLLIGIFCAAASAPINTIFQTKVPSNSLGRVWVIHELVSSIFSPAGLALSALLSDSLGVRMIILICGLLYGGSAIIGFFIPALRSLDLDS